MVLTLRGRQSPVPSVGHGQRKKESYLMVTRLNVEAQMYTLKKL